MNKKNRLVSFAMDKQQKELLKDYSKRYGKSVSAVIRGAVDIILEIDRKKNGSEVSHT